MKIGLLGGTFDPIHYGHVALAQAAVHEGGLRRVVVMPAAIQPFKQKRKISSAFDRELMVRMALAYVDETLLSRYELEREDQVSYTINSLNYLQKRYEHAEIYFVCGTDSLLSMESWYKGEEILRNFGVVVSTRPGYKEEELAKACRRFKKRYQTPIIQLKTEMPDISSTMIRERAAAGESIRGMVTMAVERYIKENELYK